MRRRFFVLLVLVKVYINEYSGYIRWRELHSVDGSFDCNSMLFTLLFAPLSVLFDKYQTPLKARWKNPFHMLVAVLSYSC